MNRIEYGTKYCADSPSIPEEELHRAILAATQDLSAHYIAEVQNDLNAMLQQAQNGEAADETLQQKLEQTKQEFDCLLEMSLELDECIPFLDDKLKKVSDKIKNLKKELADRAKHQKGGETTAKLLAAKDLNLTEYDDTLTSRIIEKVVVQSRNEIEIRFVGGYVKKMVLTSKS